MSEVRYIDRPCGSFALHRALRQGIWVKCPTCGGPGQVTADETAFHFQCESCYATQTKARVHVRGKVENRCAACGRLYRVQIPGETGFSVLRVSCPYCGHEMSGRVQKIPCGRYSGGGDIQDGREPCFGLELWFLTSYRGKPVWALNREHLAYLIGYLGADLRERPSGPQFARRTQADELPTYMKTAKNRTGIVKCLEKLGRK